MSVTIRILCIVGSVSLAGHPQAYSRIEEVITRLRPLKIISGGAEGIDTMAEEAARRHDIPFEPYLPAKRRWIDGYKPRNLKMAQDCTYLVRIVASDSTTYGSGWTRDQAARLGKPTEEYVIERSTHVRRSSSTSKA